MKNFSFSEKKTISIFPGIRDFEFSVCSVPRTKYLITNIYDYVSIEEFIIKSLLEFHLKSHMVWREIKMKILNVLHENFQTHLKYYYCWIRKYLGKIFQVMITSFLREATKDRYALPMHFNWKPIQLFHEHSWTCFLI